MNIMNQFKKMSAVASICHPIVSEKGESRKEGDASCANNQNPVICQTGASNEEAMFKPEASSLHFAGPEPRVEFHSFLFEETQPEPTQN